MATVKKGSRRKRAINVETEMTQARFKMSCGCIRTIPWSRAPFFVACLHQPPNLVNGAVIKGHRSAETAAFGSKVPSDRKKTIKYLFEELLCVCARFFLFYEKICSIKLGFGMVEPFFKVLAPLQTGWTRSFTGPKQTITTRVKRLVDFQCRTCFFCVTIFDFNDCAPVQILEIVLKD